MLVDRIFGNMLKEESEYKKEFLKLLIEIEEDFADYNIIPVFNGMLEIYTNEDIEKNKEPRLLIYYLNGEENTLHFEFKDTNFIFDIILEEEIILEYIGEMFVHCKDKN